MSAIIKRSVKIAGHATSISLEEPFWEELGRLAKAQQKSISALIAEIDEHNTGNLSSAVRIYIFQALQERLK